MNYRLISRNALASGSKTVGERPAADEFNCDSSFSMRAKFQVSSLEFQVAKIGEPSGVSRRVIQKSGG